MAADSRKPQNDSTPLSDKAGLSNAAGHAIVSGGTTGGSFAKAVQWARSLRPFKGIIQDVRARAPYYVSDWTDAWDYRVIPATVLIFFAKCVFNL